MAKGLLFVFGITPNVIYDKGERRMKKIVKFICIFIVICVCVRYGYNAIKMKQTIGWMELDDTDTIITGISDEGNVSKYKYLVIPDPTMGIASNFGWIHPFEKVTDIGEGAFQGNIWAKSVYIPKNIVRIQKNAFNGCSALVSVSYAGTEQEWKRIVIESGNDVITSRSIEYNAMMPRTGEWDYESEQQGR